MKIVTIVGARPQFIKAAALSQLLRTQHVEILVHTGQHYDATMSDIFFDELSLPVPDYHLGVGSGTHGAQTGAMLMGIETVLIDEKPDVVLIYGDTNSTLAGALAAAKLGIPVAHVEAGLRSFNREMPEEINRIVADQLAAWLFAPTEAARANLANEGITHGVAVVGDIMIDAVNLYEAATDAPPTSLSRRHEYEDGYYLCTVHRAQNTDNATNLRSIFSGLDALDRPVVMPLHPRTRHRIEEIGLAPGRNVSVISPVGYLEMLRLQRWASCVITDSGGMQKEAYALGTPCVTLRPETEWVETVEVGWNRLTDIEPVDIARAVEQMASPSTRTLSRPALYGDGHAAERICAALASQDR